MTTQELEHAIAGKVNAAEDGKITVTIDGKEFDLSGFSDLYPQPNAKEGWLLEILTSLG